MDKKVYENTRYQNIYRHKKNKNYVVMISKPVKTSISRFNGKKILSIDDALKVRDNSIIKAQKAIETKDKNTFDELWEKYINDCRYVKKLSYTTLTRKEKDYNRYFKNKIEVKVTKADTDFWSKYIDKLDCSDKQKNEMIKQIKAFYNWLIDNDIANYNPLSKIKKYKVEKTEMQFWTKEELSRFFNKMEEYAGSEDKETKKSALMIQTLVMIAFTLGDRIAETRALTFDSIDKNKELINISHSINYDRTSENFLGNTKNYQSQRKIVIIPKLIEQIDFYKDYLKNELGYQVKDNSLIFFNYATNKPYSDTYLRKQFHKYCKLCEVPEIRMYDLRHTFATIMMQEGYELYHISKMMGHKNYSTTVNEYGHISDTLKREMANSLDKYISE